MEYVYLGIVLVAFFLITIIPSANAEAAPGNTG